jgi:hypothetical protein
MAGWMMNGEFVRIWKEAVVFYPGIWLEELMNQQNPQSVYRRLDRHSNPAPHEYKSSLVTTAPTCSAFKFRIGDFCTMLKKNMC